MPTDAERKYKTAWRRRRGVRPMAEYLALVTGPHGTRGKYVHGCRCPECTRAERDYRRLVRMRTDLACACSICPATFRTVRGLNYHEHTVHKET